MALSLGPIRIAKRQWRAPWSTDPFGQDEGPDAEKRAVAGVEDHDDSSDYDESISSSRATSNSLDPMLHDPAPYSRRAASAYDDRIPRRRFNRIFTVVVGSLLVLFILLLTRLGYGSAQHVAAHRPPPRPLPYENFPFLKRYHGGVRSLIARSQNIPEYPGDEELLREDLANLTKTQLLKRLDDRQVLGSKTTEEAEQSSGKHALPSMVPFEPIPPDPDRQECFLDIDSLVKVPRLYAFEGYVSGFPDHVLGSYDLFGLRNDVCFDRFGRLGPYGFGYSAAWGGTGAGLEGDREGIEQVWAQGGEIDYTKVRWADASARCAERNRHRFGTQSTEAASLPPQASQRSTFDDMSKISPGNNSSNEGPAIATHITLTSQAATPTTGASVLKLKREATRLRSCIVIRTWHKFEYDQEDIMYLRSLITELSLASGSEYVLHFLIHVQDNDLPIWSNDDVYQRVLNESLPPEFHGMGTLWSDPQLMMLYPGMKKRQFRNIHLHGAYRSAFMPMQYFAHTHPEFDFFWHWEMDVRYTGHWYHLFDRVSAWAKQQPRKGLWERNARFYIPSVHGSWEDFRQMVRVQTEHGTSSKANILSSHVDSPAKNPNSPYSSLERPVWGPELPLYDQIDISQDPIPPTSYAKDAYSWGVGEDADLITFNPLFDPEGTEWNLEKDVTGYTIKDGKLPPRRAAIVTASRLSRRLLMAMHNETALHKHTMFSEMWPASCALQHGHKAVFAPHPVFIDRRWPTDYLAAIYNAGRNGATGGARTTPFNDAHQDNFRGVTWYYHAGFPSNLWKRWLGYRVDGDGGEQAELANEGRMCLPGMLMHPVKQTDLVYQRQPDITAADNPARDDVKSVTGP